MSEAERVEFEAQRIEANTAITCLCYVAHASRDSGGERSMDTEFSGIERRLDELSERLARLEPLRE